ncbi:MAG: hypothetical protein WAZ98_00225 [Cyclobacteriaceae bacterium]
MKNQIRHISKVKGKDIIPYEKCRFPQSDFIKVPVNIGDSREKYSTSRGWKDFKLYCKYLDLKVQNPNCGTFRIEHTHRAYQRTIKALIKRGWAWRDGRVIKLKAYQFVWRSMGINRVKVENILKFKYWKISVSIFSEKRKDYLRQIENVIREKIASRKLAQIRYALKAKGEKKDQVTFSAMSASSLFGYRSRSTGSKVRKKFFSVVETESKPYFNSKHGRFEEPTKKIYL